jgi:hypothetical protein
MMDGLEINILENDDKAVLGDWRKKMQRATLRLRVI